MLTSGSTRRLLRPCSSLEDLGLNLGSRRHLVGRLPLDLTRLRLLLAELMMTTYTVRFDKKGIDLQDLCSVLVFEWETEENFYLLMESCYHLNMCLCMV